MPEPVFITGHKTKVYLFPAGTDVAAAIPATGSVQLSSSKYTLTKKINPKDVSNSRTGRARITTLLDWTGNVSGFLDDLAPIEEDLDDDMIRVVVLMRNDTKYRYGTFIIDNLKIETGGVEDAQNWSFDLALASGDLLSGPTAP